MRLDVVDQLKAHRAGVACYLYQNLSFHTDRSFTLRSDLLIDKRDLPAIGYKTPPPQVSVPISQRCDFYHDYA